MARLALLGQGLYYLATGIWPLLHMRSFTAVTGPKVDLWLVRTVGVLVTVVGAVVALSALRRRAPTEVPLLAAGSALGLAAIDVVSVRRGEIRTVYLLEAVGEVGLALALAIGLARRDDDEY
jgi:hypothetical protein